MKRFEIEATLLVVYEVYAESEEDATQAYHECAQGVGWEPVDSYTLTEEVREI